MAQQNREEADLVEAIKAAFELRGYICQRVNQRRADLSGTDVVADLLVTHEKYPPAVWIAGEVKTQSGRLSKRRPAHRKHYGYSQQDLFDRNRIFVWRSIEEAQADIIRFERQLNQWKNGLTNKEK